MCERASVNGTGVLEWLDGEIEDVCLSSQETEEVTPRGVVRTGANNRGGVGVMCL